MDRPDVFELQASESRGDVISGECFVPEDCAQAHLWPDCVEPPLEKLGNANPGRCNQKPVTSVYLSLGDLLLDFALGLPIHDATPSAPVWIDPHSNGAAPALAGLVVEDRAFAAAPLLSRHG